MLLNNSKYSFGFTARVTKHGSFKCSTSYSPKVFLLSGLQTLNLFQYLSDVSNRFTISVHEKISNKISWTLFSGYVLSIFEIIAN